MRLDTLVDFAAALEIPLSELALEPEDSPGDKDVGLRLVRVARNLIDDLAKAGVAKFDCEIDPEDDEMEAVLELVDLIEKRLPTPWEVDQHPADGTLSEKIRLSASVRRLLEHLAAKGIGFYAVTSYDAQYPRYDMDERCRSTSSNQRYEVYELADDDLPWERRQDLPQADLGLGAAARAALCPFGRFVTTWTTTFHSNRARILNGRVWRTADRLLFRLKLATMPACSCTFRDVQNPEATSRARHSLS